MKKLLALDCDGVVAAFTPHLLATIGGRVTFDQIVDWDIFSFLNDSERAEAKKACASADWWTTIPVIDGAHSAVEMMREQHEILWCTSPWVSCFGWESVRRDWLKKHFGARHDEIMIGARKEVILADALIDDKAETVIAFQERHNKLREPGVAMLFDAPYNQGLKGYQPPRICYRDGRFASLPPADGG